MASQNIVKLDGRIGEGGGQLVRVAVSLAAITGTPISIDHVRGNRGGAKRNGGLKPQHVSCIKVLAEATNAKVTGCHVASKAIEFVPQLSPAQLSNRKIKIKANSAASISLVFQAVLPFLVFAADEKTSPISLVIEGGTNVSFSPSFEYLDQVLLPSVERFGVKVERKLEFRGWSHGLSQAGSAKFIIQPIPLGSTLLAPSWPSVPGTVTMIEISVMVPRPMLETLKHTLLFEIGVVFPEVKVKFVCLEDSKHNARMYTLLVAHTSTGLRFGRDWLYDKTAKGKSWEDLSTEISQRVVDELDNEVQKGGLVDEHLQDQLIVFQALSEGKTIIPGCLDTANSKRGRVERTDEPFGDGSTHTSTVRWVTSQLLPHLKWIDRGRICEGVGWKTSTMTVEDIRDELGSVHIV